MVNDYPEVNEETDYSLAEFFVMYKYRRSGVGKFAAMKVIDMFPGKWQLIIHPKNTTSVHFWNKVISEYTGDKYTFIESYPNSAYDDGTLVNIFLFTN